MTSGTFRNLLRGPDCAVVPAVANMFTGGKSSLFTTAELAAMGYRVALWVVDALWAAARAVQNVLAA